MTPPLEHDRVLLAEGDARRVVLVRALEEADLERVLVPPEVSEGPVELAHDPQEDPREGHLLARRAARVLDRVGEAHPVLARFGRLGMPSSLWIVAGAFLLGLLSNVFGAERRIHVLANPLVVLVLWNLAVFGLLAMASLRGRLGRSASPSSGSTGLVRRAVEGSRLARFLSARSMGGLRRAITDSEDERTAAPLARAAARYFEDWLRTSAPLMRARLHRTLHLGSIALTLGALAGMYGRGLVLEYRVHWESTFLSQERAQSLLDWTLAPASGLSGIAVPRLGTLEEDPEATRSFLHLFSLSALLLVVIPRGVLALVATRHARGLERALPLDVGSLYYRRLLKGSRGRGVEIDVHPYSFTLSPARGERAAHLLHAVFGGEASVRVHASLPWGVSGSDVPLGQENGTHAPLVVLFNLAQTPERELQGTFLEELRPLAGGGFVALADCSAWRERVGAGPTFADRMQEHRGAWERLAAEVGVPIVHVDLEAEADEEVLTRIEAALEGRSPSREAALDRGCASTTA